MYLVFDLETTGLPEFRKGLRRYYDPESSSDRYSKSRIVSVAWILFNDRDQTIRARHALIRPTGFVSDDSSIATSIHGITSEALERFGEDFVEVFSDFYRDIQLADCVVGHNVDFDLNVLRAELSARSVARDLSQHLKKKRKRCTKDLGSGKRLGELYKELIGDDLEGAHNALVDVEACAVCYSILKDVG